MILGAYLGKHIGTTTKIQHPFYTLPPNGKKIGPIGCMLIHLISNYLQIFMCIFILYHFGPRLMARAQIPVV
jgi:hypothetical protein